VIIQGVFPRFHRRRATAAEAAVIGCDGWVELADGRLVVHDPASGGRPATLIPEPGIRLWINGQEATDPTPVSAGDQVRYAVIPEPLDFFELGLTEDEMVAHLRLTADPYRIPDTVAAAGRHRVRLYPACSTRAEPRPMPPREAILDALAGMGVVFGIDEAHLDQELGAPSGCTIIIARGQELEPAEPGRWVCLPDGTAVETGQVVVACQGGHPVRPRITVTGKATPPVGASEPPLYRPGPGVRCVPGSRLVATQAGTVRVVPIRHGYRVTVTP
jgi:hypothetical protein